MKKLIQKFIFFGLTVIVNVTILFGFASNVFAAPLDVVFTPDPLFNKTNFLPLDETSGIVTVANNSGSPQTILTEAINVLDNDDFGGLLRLKIVGNSIILFDDSLADFFSTAGEVPLGAIPNGESKTFTYTISFIDSDNNDYQGKTLGFDVCVGFSGGTKHCGDTVIGGENNTGGGGGGGSISGAGGGPIILTILNEETESVVEVGGFPATATAIIVWDTNVLSTSQVIYGLLSESPYTLDMNAANFGYPFGTIENTTKVLQHSVLLTGLIPGETYLYRVVSRASPPTISFERQFTVPATASLLAQAGNNNKENNNFTENNQSSDALNISNAKVGTSISDTYSDTSFKENTSVTKENVINSNSNLLTASAFLSNFGNLISNNILIFILLILLILYIIWIFWLRKKKTIKGKC